MTRVLYWNIENFGYNKIANPSAKRKRGSSVPEAEGADNRLYYITQVLRAVQPDIVVVVEVESAPFIGPGILTETAGTIGARQLRADIQFAVGGTWRLVPPLQTGPTEAVAIFYNDANRYFTGPWVWPGGIGGPPRNPALPGPTNLYGLPWRTLLPNRVVPGGSMHNAGANERQLAARTTYTYAAGHATKAGQQFLWYAYERRPYMATFYESAAPARNVTIFGIHAPAFTGGSRYLRNMAKLAQVVDGLNANEVRLVIGDWNVDLLDATLAEDPAYGPLQATYTLALQQAAPAPPVPALAYTQYFATHIRRQFKAKCWPRVGSLAPYPGYRYTSATGYAIDNAFFRYGAGLAQPVHNFTVMNPVVGSPVHRACRAGRRPSAGHGRAEPPALRPTARGAAGGGPGVQRGADRRVSGLGRIRLHP